jgi:hypothetical protein
MRIFISYAQRDQELADRLAEVLRRNNFQVWDETLLLPGESWAQSLEQALQDSEAIVVLFTPNSVHSSKVSYEIGYALGEKKYKGRLIPVVAAPSEEVISEIPWVFKLDQFQIIQAPNLKQDETEQNRVVQALKAVA